MISQLMTAAQVGEVLQLGHTAVYELLASGRLPSFRVGTGPRAQYRVSEEQLAEYLAESRSVGR